MKKRVTKKVCMLLAMMMLLISMFSTTVFAATEYGPGEYYLGQFNFTDSNTGAARTYNAKFMRIKVAWKKGESDITTKSDIDLYVDVYRVWNGKSAYTHQFTPSEDRDGKDSDGYYYVESPWFEVNNGSDYRIYYEAFTTPGQTGTGSNRKGNVHTWIELSNSR